jgi:hypothetical protein
MAIVRNRLERTCSVIKLGQKPGAEAGVKWWYSDGTFVNFASDVNASSYSSKVKDDNLKRKCLIMHGHLSRIKNDLDALLNICSQANWQKQKVLENHLDKFHAMQFGSVVADAFITRYRLSYETIGLAFREVANNPGSVSTKFKVLRNACKQDEGIKNLGKDLADLIQSADWFDQIKAVRDAIIHYNFDTSGFMAERILF